MRSLLLATALLTTLPSAATATDLPSGWAATPHLTEVKVGIDYLNQEQLEELWYWADTFAWAESVHLHCGKSANIERRSLDAVKACVDDASLQKVRSRYRARLEAHKAKGSRVDCQEANVKKILREVEALISRQIAKAAAMCRSCFIC